MNITQVLRTALAGHVSPLTLDAALRRHVVGVEGAVAAVPESERARIASRLEEAVGLFSMTPRQRLRDLLRTTLALDATQTEGTPIDVAILKEMDVNVARNQARLVARHVDVHLLEDGNVDGSSFRLCRIQRERGAQQVTQTLTRCHAE